METQHHLATPLAEAEVKIALSADEYQRLPERVLTLGFQSRGSSALIDYYLHYTHSESGGWDFLRLRVQDGATYWLTRKEWVRDARGQAVRMEEEHAIPTAQAAHLLSENPNALQLQKSRREFSGEIAGEPASIVLDALQLGEQLHYFIECEVMTSAERAQQVRDSLLYWIHATLDIASTTEAKSMLELIQAYREE